MHNRWQAVALGAASAAHPPKQILEIRFCVCGTKLSRYNKTNICSCCEHKRFTRFKTQQY